MYLLEIWLTRHNELFLQAIFSLMILVFPSVLVYSWYKNKKMKNYLDEKKQDV
jgi:ABC-type uncharacterized transport system permease subunit